MSAPALEEFLKLQHNPWVADTHRLLNVTYAQPDGLAQLGAYLQGSIRGSEGAAAYPLGTCSCG